MSRPASPTAAAAAVEGEDPTAGWSAAVMEHMNADHSDALRYMAQHFGKMPGGAVVDAMMVALNSKGFDLRCTYRAGAKPAAGSPTNAQRVSTAVKKLYISFTNPILDRLAMRKQLITMSEAAAKACGAQLKTGDEKKSPAPPLKGLEIATPPAAAPAPSPSHAKAQPPPLQPGAMGETAEPASAPAPAPARPASAPVHTPAAATANEVGNHSRSDASPFVVAVWWSWPAVLLGLLLTGLLAFLPQPEQYALLAPFNTLGLFLFRSTFGLRIVFWVAMALHVLEGFSAFRHSRALGFSGRVVALWTVQTVLLGYPSLKELMVYVVRAEKERTAVKAK